MGRCTDRYFREARRAVALLPAVLILTLFAAPAQAQCVGPGVGPGTVTCSGTTINPAGDGYGTGAETGQTINVQPGATVRGSDNGIFIDADNVVNNRGAVIGDTQDGISAIGSITVNNFFGGSIVGGPGRVGILAGGDITLQNAGSIYGEFMGVSTFVGTVNAYNSGSIRSDFAPAINGVIVNLTNSGTVASSGAMGVGAVMEANVVNNAGGSIFGAFAGIQVQNGNTTVFNAGSITGTFAGIDGSGGFTSVVNTGLIAADPTMFLSAGVVGFPLNLTNYGTIIGETAVLAAGGGSTIVNAGWLIGSYASIDLTASGGDTITFLPGSRLIGSVELGFGAPSTVNIMTGRDIAWLITFGACGCGGLVENQSIVNFLGGAPGIVVGNQIATLDPTAFGQTDKVLMNFTGWISSILANRMGDGGLGNAAFAAFAPVASPVVATATEAFASVLPATAYAADKGVGAVPQAGMVDRHSGTAVWTNAFGGFRNQQADGPNLASRSTGYGGAIGIDGQWRPDLRVGAFIGAGQGNFDVDRNSQSIDSDYVYGGVYGRFEWLTHFLDWAVQAGRSDNKSQRLVANNMAPGGLETASASYDGWYVSPEIAYGVRLPINANMTLTPTARVRYLTGQFDSYNETGSAQTLSVGTRNLQNLEERFELALTLYEPMSAGIIKTTATLGALAQQRIGDRTIDTVLIGQDLAFATPGQNSSFGGFAGLAFDYRITSSANIYGGVEAAIMDDRSTTATARGGVRVRF